MDTQQNPSVPASQFRGQKIPDLRDQIPSHFGLGHALNVRQDVLGFLLQAQSLYPYACQTQLGLQKVILAFHPEAVGHILVKNAKNYSKKSFITNSLQTILGKGLLSNDGDSWARQRKALQPLFSLERAKAAESQISDLAKSWAEGLKNRVAQKPRLEMSLELMSITRKIISEVILGEDLSRYSSEIDGEFEFLTSYVYSRSVNPLALPVWAPTPQNIRFRKLRERLNTIIYSLIDRAHSENDNLLNRLKNVHGEDGETLTREEIRDEVMTLFLAGHETTANSVSWLLKTAFENPHWLLKVQEENNSSGPLLQAFLHETYRLYSPAWSLVRTSLNEDHLGPYEVPAKTLVVLSQWATHRHPDFWPFPEQFMPERFLSHPTNPLQKFAFFPFGAGPRVCIGQNLALIIVRQLFHHLMQNLKIENISPQNIRLNPTTSLAMKDPFFVDFKSRFSS